MVGRAPGWGINTPCPLNQRYEASFGFGFGFGFGFRVTIPLPIFLGASPNQRDNVSVDGGRARTGGLVWCHEPFGHRSISTGGDREQRGDRISDVFRRLGPHGTAVEVWLFGVALPLS
jgi:hypothetical protein